MEFPDRYDGLHARLMIVRVRISENSEAFARNLQALEQGDMESIQFNLAFEAGGKRLNN